MPSIDYVVCVPSYKRANVCKEKTLTMLKKNKISASKINVYVANDEEYAIYKETLPKDMYNKLVVGIKGLVPQRQFISEQFPEGKHIVFIDDDVESVDLSLSKFKSLDTLISHAFKAAHDEDAYIWGIYPVFNPFFRKGRKEMTSHLTYIVGAFYGIINRPKLKSIQLELTKENGQKEDVERTIKYYIQDGKVLRFNKIGFTTKYYGKEGGLGTFEARLAPMKEASERLLKEYPEFGKVTTRPSGMTEFTLKQLKELPERFTHQTNKVLQAHTKKSRKSTAKKTLKRRK
jgi:cellulose synthase/poly-beta-1,6-N-acetylglucosamine synthase-like glycosyltransferase